MTPASSASPASRLVLPETPIGPLALEASARGIRAVHFGVPPAWEAWERKPMGEALPGPEQPTGERSRGEPSTGERPGWERAEIRTGASRSVDQERSPARLAALEHLKQAESWLVWSLGMKLPTEGSNSPPPSPAAEPPTFPALDLDGAAGGTPFRLRVWDALLRIPRGRTTSYGDLARSLDQGSPRAVGQAVGANPLPVLIPCHRVVATNGGLGGFSGGLERKIALLGIEGAAEGRVGRSGG